MQLKRGQFFINQHYSSEFNVYIQNRPASVSASRVIELREREGNDSIII
ncbi:TPA: phage tail protein, partial [Enterococcus faecium]